ncbi:MAG TPA: flagellar biosynthesis protein FlhB [Rectinemataceae bacterium]|nr:flagellar biosynthesis protein FlhB [Rectinemataceae bacterium]
MRRTLVCRADIHRRRLRDGDLAASPGFDAAISISDIHLQWFAAEDEGRTEEPSEYKIRKAREDGKVAKSQELNGAIGLLIPASVLVVISPWMLGTLREMLLYYFTIATKTDIVTSGGVIAASFMSYFARLAIPLGVAGMVSAIASNLLQVGFLFSVKPITPDFSRIVPHFGQWLSRSLFSTEGLFNMAKTVAKVAIVAAVSWITISSQLDKLLSSITTSFWVAVAFVASLAMRLVIEVAVLLLVLSVPDLLFQRRQYKESLKMSREEVKEERKMMEGDPLVKSRLRQRMQDLLTKNMAANVPKADVVIANPTHYAVALEWNREAMAAPVVTAKGVDEMALRIRRIAEESAVPVVENRPLARALYADVEIGDPIPEKYYQAIAAVLASVYSASGEAKLYREAAGGAAREPAAAGAPA